MAKKVLLVLCVLVALCFTGCVTTSSVGGTVDTHGIFTMDSPASQGGKYIASYGVILGLFDVGYEGYVREVEKEVRAGKVITSVTKWYLGFFIKVTAYEAP